MLKLNLFWKYWRSFPERQSNSFLFFSFERNYLGQQFKDQRINFVFTLCCDSEQKKFFCRTILILRTPECLFALRITCCVYLEQWVKQLKWFRVTICTSNFQVFTSQMFSNEQHFMSIKYNGTMDRLYFLKHWILPEFWIRWRLFKSYYFGIYLNWIW